MVDGGPQDGITISWGLLTAVISALSSLAVAALTRLAWKGALATLHEEIVAVKHQLDLQTKECDQHRNDTRTMDIRLTDSIKENTRSIDRNAREIRNYLGGRTRVFKGEGLDGDDDDGG